jgi:hypothetical protein
MKAKLVINRLRTGDIARNYIRLVKESQPRHLPVEADDASTTVKAQAILETIESQNQPDDLDFNIDGKNLLKHMDQAGLTDLTIPYWFTSLAKSRGEAIVSGVHVLITGDPSRTLYKTVEVSFQHQSIVVIDAGDNEFVLPWDLIEPAEGHERDRPYWFTADARKKGEGLEIGDYVQLIGMPTEQYELTDIFWQYGDVEIRKVGSSEYLGMPWDHVEPWKKGRLRREE